MVCDLARGSQFRTGAAPGVWSMHSDRVIRPVIHNAKAVAALIGMPLGAMFLVAVFLNFVEPEWDEDSCRWCGWLMGGAGLCGLLFGMSLAHGIWATGRPPGEATDRRSQVLVAAWFWTAICLALILLPAIAQGRGWLVLLGAACAAPAVAVIAWATRL